MNINSLKIKIMERAKKYLIIIKPFCEDTQK